MTHSDTQPATVAAGFQFMRCLRDPEFRELLSRNGWKPGEHVVVSHDDEPVVDVMAKIILHDTGGHALVAIADADQPFGFRLMKFGTRGRRGWLARVLQRPAETIRIGPNASMGMLYAAFRRSGKYVPSEWSAPVTVQKVAEAV